MKNLKSAISCEMYLRENEHLIHARSPSFGKKDQRLHPQQHSQETQQQLVTESHVVLNVLDDHTFDSIDSRN